MRSRVRLLSLTVPAWAVLVACSLAGCLRESAPPKPLPTVDVRTGSTPAASRRIAELEAQLQELRDQVVVLQRKQDAEANAEPISDPDLHSLKERLDRLIDLGEKTHTLLAQQVAKASSVSKNQATANSSSQPRSRPSQNDEVEQIPVADMGALPSLAASEDLGVAALALMRALDRLGLSPEQKKVLISSLRPARPLDRDNPWQGTLQQ